MTETKTIWQLQYRERNQPRLAAGGSGGRRLVVGPGAWKDAWEPLSTREAADKDWARQLQYLDETPEWQWRMVQIATTTSDEKDKPGLTVSTTVLHSQP